MKAQSIEIHRDVCAFFIIFIFSAGKAEGPGRSKTGLKDLLRSFVITKGELIEKFVE